MDINVFFKTLDELFTKGDLKKIEAYLVESLEKAKDEKDYGSYVSIGNEMIGYYRSVSEFDKCFAISEDTLMLMEELQLDDSEHFGTTLLNVATGYRAAGRLNESLSYYTRALKLYEQLLEPGDYRFAGLYNNISILLEQLGENEKAIAFLQSALSIIDKIEEAKSEQASTRTNLALVYSKVGKVDEARELLFDAVARYEMLKEEQSDAHYSAALAGLGELLYKEGKLEESLKYYEKAMEEVKLHFGENDGYQMLAGNVALIRQMMEKA